MSVLPTADLCDSHEALLLDGSLRVLPLTLRDYGGRRVFHGRVATLRVFEDNSLVREALMQPGDGRVLFVDGGGSLRCALVGGNLGVLAVTHGWAGVVVHGCVRDAAELVACEVGVRALGTNPRKSRKAGAGERDVVLDLGGVTVAPDEWCYADTDGLLVSSVDLARAPAPTSP